MNDVCISVEVEPRSDGAYDVVTRKDGKPWLRHGPYQDLDFANMTCREMLKRAEMVRDRLIGKQYD